jgi:hypothetical protein
MLCSIPRLLQRAEELDPSRARQRQRHDAAGEAFQELDSRLRAAARARDLQLAESARRQHRPESSPSRIWSSAAGWFLAVGLFATVLIGLVGIGS